MTRDSDGRSAMLREQTAQPRAEPIAASDMAGKAAAENFPVALRMLPPRHRDHLMAVYTFARTVDDIGDEAPPEQRLPLLAELRDDVGMLYAGLPDNRGANAGPDGAASQPRHPAVRGLAGVVINCAVPAQPFLDLIAANEQDQIVSRYETFDDLLSYCTLSANPVGRIVLHVFGCSTPGRAELSDSVCSGLQVVEHLQDVAEDFRAGRIYLPLADMRSHGCTEEDLAEPRASPQLRRLIAAECARAGTLISEGSPLVAQLRGAARVAVAGYVAGGRAALAAIAQARYDVLAATPRPSKIRTAGLLLGVLARGR